MSARLPSPGDVTLEARGVTVHLGGAPILTGIDLDLRSGEVTVLVGPNGAGKSTLFGVLAGDVEPLEGAVRIIAGSPAADGATPRDLADVSALRPKELSRRRAVQMQDSRLAFAFTARDAVEMGRAPWAGTPEEERDDEVIAAALAAGEVTHLAARQVPSLSGGERARVAFARLLAQETEILLLDEPTAALDIRHQEQVIASARARARAGATVMVIVHDLSLAAAYADRIVLLEDGRVRAVGPPAEVLTAELVSEVYQHPVSVLTAPEGGELLIVPVRRRPDADASAPLDIPMELPA
jgi:iron complex transport system ATP-binding protein